MGGVGKDLRGSSRPTFLPKQGHLQQAAQDCVQAGLEYLQRRRLHNLSRQPVPGLHHPESEEVLPHVQLELPMLQKFVPFAPCPVCWAPLKRVWPHPPDTHPWDIHKILPQSSLLQAKQAQLPQPFLLGEMLQSPHHLCSPPLDSLQSFLVFLEVGSPELRTILHMWPH